MSFTGFSSGVEVIPTQFFENLLPEINSISELKVSLFSFYLLNQFAGDQRYLTRSDFLDSGDFMTGLTSDGKKAESVLDDGLEKAVIRGTLIAVQYQDTVLYFLNSPKGRAAVAALESGEWMPDAFLHLSGSVNVFRPNVFQIYEENIGPLTPLIADRLKDAEAVYTQEWVSEAIEISVVNNARNWRYIETVLKSWKENGRSGIY